MEPAMRNTKIRFKQKKPGFWRLHEIIGVPEESLRKMLMEATRRAA